MSMRTPLGRVLGSGSAHEGTGHFWRQRLTGLALVPLAVIAIWVVIVAQGRTHPEVIRLVGSPIVAIALIGLIVATAMHMRIGMQVIIEDYVHGEIAKISCVIANNFFSVLIGLASVWAVVKLSFGV